MYKIKVGKLLEEVGTSKQIKDSVEIIDPDDSFQLAAPLEIDIDLISLRNSIFLKGQAKMQLKMNCSRCNQSFVQEIDFSFEEVYKKEEDLLHFDDSDKELGPEDLYFVIEDDDTIDIEEVLRQNIITALPIKAICSINCKPVRLSVGEEKQEKAFADLKKLLDRKE